MKNQLYRIPQINWQETEDPDRRAGFMKGVCQCEVWRSGTGQWRWGASGASGKAPENTEESARQACEDRFSEKMEALLEPDDSLKKCITFLNDLVEASRGDLMNMVRQAQLLLKHFEQS